MKSLGKIKINKQEINYRFVDSSGSYFEAFLFLIRNNFNIFLYLIKEF
jgi:hypothetical protein